LLLLAPRTITCMGKVLGAITLDFEYQKVAYMNKILIIRETYGGTQSECDP
jgi:hypothetical protein